MINTKIETKIGMLRGIIMHHDILYYGNDSPEISDREYDMTYRELRNMVEDNPEYDIEDLPPTAVGCDWRKKLTNNK